MKFSFKIIVKIVQVLFCNLPKALQHCNVDLFLTSIIKTDNPTKRNWRIKKISIFHEEQGIESKDFYQTGTFNHHALYFILNINNNNDTFV